MSNRKISHIGVAVVEYQRRFLVGIRNGDSPLAGYHEFPGGKCHTGEPSSACAARECREETGLEVIPVHELLSVQHSYDHAELDLDFWLCRPADASDELFQQTLHGFHWIPAAELPDLSFPAANSEIVELLVKEYASE